MIPAAFNMRFSGENMIIAKLTRYLEYGDRVTLEIQLPFAPFAGLVIDTSVSMRGGTFTVSITRYNPQTGVIWLSEDRNDWNPGPHFTQKPDDEWLDQEAKKNEHIRSKRLKEYEEAGWSVKRSDKKTSVSYSYRP